MKTDITTYDILELKGMQNRYGVGSTTELFTREELVAELGRRNAN